jgi:DNA-binding MarR family transcriptional regulator
MNAYFVDDEGHLHERHVRDIAEWHAANTPLRDPLAWEANGLAIRVGHAVLDAGRPRKPSLSVGQYLVLRHLLQAERHRLMMSELSREVSLTVTGVTKIVDSLVAAGHLRRVEHASDRRKVWAQLTATGIDYASEVVSQVCQRVERTWSPLTEREKRILAHLLAKVKLQLHVAARDERLLENEEFD